MLQVVGRYLSKAKSQELLCRNALLILIYVLAFSIRLFSVLRYESVIHEFDPYFNYRSTIKLVTEGYYEFWNWFDAESWHPLGRVVGGTVYPGLMYTAAALFRISTFLTAHIKLRDVCVFTAPFFAGNTAMVAYLFGKQLKDEGTGIVAAALMAIVPGYISRSVAGSYDNEAVAIFALLTCFYLWVRAVNLGTVSSGVAAAFGYLYMAASWGAYVFISNLIPLYVIVMVCCGRWVPGRVGNPQAAQDSSITNAVGMSLLVSGSIRYRFYIQNGLTTAEVARVVLFCTASFWLGLLALTGVTLLCVPLPVDFPLSAYRIEIALALTLVPLLWLAGGLMKRPLRIARWRFNTPSPATGLRQILIGAFDWGLAAAVLYVLMPDQLNNGFGHFLAIFVIAQIIGLISHVPGGLGVFEAVMLAGFGATGNEELAAPILGALAVFRVTYYLLPLCGAIVMVLQREARGLRQKSLLSPWFTGLLPSFFAGLTLVSGAVLLFSGATRALPNRMETLREVLPLSVLEVSHLLASVIGMLLLILARGLQRRLDAAYVLTLVLLVAGAVFSLLKGIDYEEAALLTLLAMALAPAHRLFYRRASLFSTTFSLGWILAIIAVLGCAVWLVMFSFKHVDYSNSLWWEFSFHEGGAPRALRALVAAAAAGMLFAVASRAMSSNETEAFKIMRQLDVDYVLVIFGGLSGYSSDDINKFLWMVRISGGVFPEHIKESDYLAKGDYTIGPRATPTMLSSIMYKMCFWEFGNIMTENNKPTGFDRVRQTEIGSKDYTLDHMHEAFTSEHWIVRIFKVNDPENRWG
ncbi:MAG: hypothetical protein WDW38_010335 [Sanguina aurantia]